MTNKKGSPTFLVPQEHSMMKIGKMRDKQWAWMKESKQRMVNRGYETQARVKESNVWLEQRELLQSLAILTA